MWVIRSFRSNQMSDVSKSLRSLIKNEQPWAIRSDRSEEMTDCERIAQVAYQKWAKEWIANFFERIAHLLIFGQKTCDSLGHQMSEFPALSKCKTKPSRNFLKLSCRWYSSNYNKKNNIWEQVTKNYSKCYLVMSPNSSFLYVFNQWMPYNSKN